MKNSYKCSLSVFLIITILVSIVFYIILWNKTTCDILEVKKQNRTYFEKLEKQKEHGFFKIEFDSLNKKQVLLSQKEIQKINDHIDFLANEVYKESNRAESLIDKDIDRLNLYMAIGIGFLSLFGIFIPIASNILSSQDFRESIRLFSIKQKKQELTQKNQDKQLKQIVEKNDEATLSIEKVESQVKNAIPRISVLNLQYSINRFFILAPYLIIERDSEKYKRLLESIKNGFEECKNNQELSILSNSSLRSTIIDFRTFLLTFKNLTTISDKTIFKLFFELSSILTELLEISHVENEKDSFNKIIQNINQILQQINSQYQDN